MGHDKGEKNETSENPAVEERIPVVVQKIIKNQTARRIGISSKKNYTEEKLIIPPFGSRTLSEDILEEYDCEAWQKLNLVAINDVRTGSESDPDMKFIFPGCMLILFSLFLIIAIPTAIASQENLSWSTVLIISAGFLLSILIGFMFAYRSKKAQTPQKSWKWFLKHLPGFILLLIISIGLPALIVYFFGGVRQLVEEGQIFSNDFLVKGLELIFVAIVCTLPPLMYFLFGRQQLEKLRESFMREVMMLDPNIQTISEAGTKYDLLFDSVYGSENTPLNAVPIYISTALITLGWILTMALFNEVYDLYNSNLFFQFTPNAYALNFGFLGAYFFAINMVFRRYVRADLTPKTYTHVSIRFIVTLILVWVISWLPEQMSGGDQTNGAGILILAFIIGIFPETGMALILNSYRKIFKVINKTYDEKQPLTDLDGINLYDRARFLEEGIENIENLAHHNLVELMVRTRIPTPRLVDQFDQAILYLHLGLEAKDLEKTRQKIREYGIRTATDLEQVIGKINLLENESPQLVKRLRIIYNTLSDDEWMEYLKHWRRSTAWSEQTADIKDFYAPIGELDKNNKVRNNEIYPEQ